MGATKIDFLKNEFAERLAAVQKARRTSVCGFEQKQKSLGTPSVIAPSTHETEGNPALQ